MASIEPSRLPRAAPIRAIVVAAACSTSSAAWAQYGGGYPTLPATVPNTRVGDLRGQLQAYLANSPPRTSGPAFLVETSLGVDFGITDNALRVERPRRADVFTTISPSLGISGDTARLKVNLSYTPVASVYAQTSGQTRFDQYGNAVVLATIVPETVFVDLRGSVTQQSRTGGYTDQNTQQLNRDDQVQTASFSVTPYAEHRFGGWGTGRAGYSIARTIQDGRTDQNGFSTNQAVFNSGLSANGLNTTGFGLTGNLTTQRERASFVTGENLGRVNDILVLEAIQYSGGGAYRGAYRNQFTNDVGYAITRTITALAGFGYQDVRFNGTPPFRIDEPIWRFGGRVTPNQDSSITVTYGRKDGFNAIAADGSYAPTARTRLFVRYSTGLTTDAEEQQNLLASTNVGPNGLLVDSVTGAPVSSSSGSFGTQNGLFKLRRFSASGVLVLNRDSVSIGFTNDERTTVGIQASVVGDTTVPSGTSSNGLSGTLSWAHELTPSLTSAASVSYSVNDNGSVIGGGASGSQRTIQTSLALNYAFTATLTGSARYLFADRSGGTGRTTQNQNLNLNAFGFNQAGQNSTENILLVGLRKSF